MNKKKKIILFLSVILFIVLIILYILYFNNNRSSNTISNVNATNVESTYDSSDLDESYSNITAKIKLSDNNTSIDGSGVTVNGNTITITSAGTYYISGTLTNGNIIINTTKNDLVKLVLANVNITSSSTSAIYCEQASKLIITLEKDSVNYLEDATTYKSTSDDELDGALFSKADLTINGKGSLEVKANYKDGIVSKDTLNIIDSTIKITAADDAIRGKDYTQINNATINIEATGDGIKATNDTDSSLGYIIIENSNINISAGADGIQAVTIVSIKSGTLNITTGGGSSNSKKTTSTNSFYNGSKSTTTDSSSSAKGIKSSSEINIDNGTITINSSDDAIHSNGNVIISNGTISIQTGDDGIHADSNIKINGGTIDIQKSYEGIESMYIEINAGTINVVSSDDGINVAGGTDSSSVNGRPGQNSFNSNNSNIKLVINGGTITVNSTGDGLDGNGSMYITGGNITVFGPTANDNGALDYDSECVVSGGTLVAIGSSGMIQAPSSNSTQCSFTTTISGSAGDTIEIKTSSGDVLTSFTAAKAYQMLTFSSNSLQTGQTYSVYVNGTLKTTISQSSTTTQIGSATMGGMQGGRR